MGSLISLIPLALLLNPGQPADLYLQQGSAGVALDDTETQTQSLILTPGQNAEIKLEAKPNDVILATVTSSSFDPAVQLQTKDGVVIKENDDVAQGDQSAQIIARLNDAGEYKLVVSGFKGAAGGQFTIRIRRFNAPPVTGERTSADFSDKNEWRSIQVKKGVPSMIAFYGAGNSIPTGFDSRGINIDNRRDAYPFNMGGRFVYESDTDQEIYIFIPRRGYRNYTLDVVPVKYEQITVGGTITGNLPRSQAIVYRFRAKPGDLLRAQAGPGKNGYQVQVRPFKLDNKQPNQPMNFVPGQVKNSNQNTFYIHEPGEYEVMIAHSDFRDKGFDLSLKDFTNVWANETATQSLPINENLYYKWDMPLGVLLDLSAVSSVFDVNFTLYAPDGNEIINMDDNGESTNPDFQMLVTRPGTYFLRVGSHGDGGGGQFTLKRQITLPTEFKSGATIKVGNAKPELRLIPAKQGEFFYLALDSADNNVQVSVFSPNGEPTMVSSMLEPSGRRIFLVNPKQSGNHLITVRTDKEQSEAKLTVVNIK